jgi:hypothetical protein
VVDVVLAFVGRCVDRRIHVHVLEEAAQVYLT